MPRVDCTAPLQPAPGNISQNKSPMFLVGGSADTIVAPGTLITPLTYNPARVPVIYGIQKGASHFEPVGNGGGIRGYLTAWMRYHLLNDLEAKKLFYGENCGLCTDSGWNVRKKNWTEQ